MVAVSTMNVDPSMVGVVYWSFPQMQVIGNDWVSFHKKLTHTMFFSISRHFVKKHSVGRLFHTAWLVLSLFQCSSLGVHVWNNLYDDTNMQDVYRRRIRSRGATNFGLCPAQSYSHCPGCGLQYLVTFRTVSCVPPIMSLWVCQPCLSVATTATAVLPFLG